MRTVQGPAAVVLCPGWARFFQRGDGEWIAFCSAAACEQLDIERPGWREFGEAPRSATCGLGWPDSYPRTNPSVVVRGDGFGRAGFGWIWSKHLRSHGFPNGMQAPQIMTDAEWGRYIEAFLEWTPPVAAGS